MTLAQEFIERYLMFYDDHKPHRVALKLTEDEFLYKLDIHVCISPTYFFIDDSCADFVDGGWDLFVNTSDN